MSESLAYTITGMSCEHCARAVHDEVAAVPGVTAATVDLAAARLIVLGDHLDDDALRAAVEEAGYGATPAAP